MKMKKLTALLLTAALALGTLTASGQEETPQTDEGDYYEIVMAVPTLGAEPSGLADVEAALNAEVGPELGVKVTMYPISLADLYSQQTLLVSSGDKLDLISVFFSGVGPYLSMGALMELDDLYAAYGADIKAAEGIAVAGGYYNGKLYAIPSEEKLARSYGFFARADILQELNMSYDANAVYSYDDLEALFAAYKEKYGDGYYCIAGNTATSDFYTYLHEVDVLGGGTSDGVLMDGGLGGNTTVESMYQSEAYGDYAQRMYDWAQKGYIPADAATNTDTNTLQIQSGYYLGCFSSTETDMISNMSRDCGYEMVPINTIAPWCQTSMYQTTMWGISATCENPEKTFQFLNYMYADNTIDNLLTYGLEGVSYEVVEKGEKDGQMVIRYADGVDAANTPYNMAMHVYGDKTTIAVFEPMTLDYYTMCEQLNNSIPDNRKSVTLGYVFDSTPVSSQASAVSAVVQQYCGLIAAGAQNPDVVLPEFRDALKAAGEDEIIAENQKQLDAWLAQQ